MYENLSSSKSSWRWGLSGGMFTNFSSSKSQLEMESKLWDV